MTCYMGHMGWLFEALGATDDKAGRKQMDAALRRVLDMPAQAHCPEIWAAIKALSDEGRAMLVDDVRRDLTGAG